MDQGTVLENEDKQGCHSCMSHFMLTYSIILLSIIKIFQMVAELCSGNENDLKLWIRGHNWKTNTIIISRVVILVRDTPR